MQCPKITDTNLEKSEIDLKTVNYYGGNIEPFDSADIFCEKQIQSDNEKISTINSRNKKVANSPKQGIFFGRLVFRFTT